MSIARRNGRASAVATVTEPVRCAIYCRKSTTEGLDSDFSSIDNQRLAAENFIASQRHEGWSALPERFDDGGFSGGTVERPALKRLMAEVEAGSIDTIVVYKLDRLSRSLVDFGRIHEFLENHSVALVSVTESINTTSPHGRMMVNVLLSFAQYERELVGERTRDKLAASRRRGRYVGGYPPLGYDRDPAGGRLLVNESEAKIVREVFRLFLECRSLIETSNELTRRGITLKRWTTKGGKVYGGGRIDKTNLRRMLTNHVYIGKVLFEGQVYDGEHTAIVPRALFQRVQRLLAENHRSPTVAANKHGALLRGLLTCGSCGTAMVHQWTRRGARVHRYYVCNQARKAGWETCPTKSVKADTIETFLVDQIRRVGADPKLQEQTFREAIAQLAAQRRGARAEARRLERELVAARAEVERLVGTLSRTTGSAADAVRVEIEKSQERIATLESRLAEVRTQETALAQHVDEADVARALEAFDPIWDVLLSPEKERIIRLLIAGIRYDGATGRLDIDWRLAGFGELAQEVGGG